jgi:protein-glutamine gamma-glutamyltransferase
LSQAKADAPERAPAALFWACAALAGGLLLHVDRLPAWAVAGTLAMILWRLTVARPSQLLTGATVRALLALALVALVLARFHTVNGLTAGTTLLVLMAALKLLEARRARDAYVIVGVALFLVLAACLDRQDLARVPLYGLEALLCCAALALIASPGLGGAPAFRLAGRTLLLALPLALALFLLFPRLPGALWAIPQRDEAVTGLSESMTPGGITRLISTYEPVFRVTFSGVRPPPQQLYWRGPVLHEFDGATWRRRPASLGPRAPLQYLGTPYHYRVALEPSRQRYWFALDTPARSPDPTVLLTEDRELIAGTAVNAPVSFEAVSYTHTLAAGPLEPDARRDDSALPPGNPRTLAFARTLRERAPTDEALLQAALEFLRTGGFSYSVTPQRLGPDAVDDFLFRTREGFCGHYASAFVALMRAAGVPARVVTGYLGGEWNPIGGYLLVRQSDAHAWAEVWLPGRGWTRIDPTAVVAPERLRRGLLELLPQALSAPERLLRESRWLSALLQRWDAANAWWNARVVRFDLDEQLSLLARLGVRAPDARYLGWAFMLVLSLWLAFGAWRLGDGVPRTRPPDPLARAYARLCRKLARAVPPRRPQQGPLDFAAAVSARRPDLASDVLPLFERYAQLRYGFPSPATRQRDVAEFARAVARLSLKRAARHGSGRPVT